MRDSICSKCGHTGFCHGWTGRCRESGCYCRRFSESVPAPPAQPERPSEPSEVQFESIDGEQQTQQMVLRNLAMLVRRLAHKHPNEKLREQAHRYLEGEGLQGSVLRAALARAAVSEPSEWNAAIDAAVQAITMRGTSLRSTMKITKQFVGVRLLPSQIVRLKKLAEKTEGETFSSLIQAAIAKFLK